MRRLSTLQSSRSVLPVRAAAAADLVVHCIHHLILSSITISVFSFASVVAQSTLTGGITGVVRDPDGAVVANVGIEITNERTRKVERSIKNEADGSYTATLLPPGSYTLRVTAANFKQSLIASVSPVMGQSIDAPILERLPLASPNVLFLLSLSSGTSGDLTDVRINGRGSASITVNGGRTSNNSISLEGINVSDFNLAQFDNVPLPNPDALQEFKVATSLYDASLGSKGGGALGFVLKSGSQEIHSDLYWRHRNDALNANEWFRNANGLSNRARLLQNVFGGTASGPAPKVGGFWFVNYQGIRARNGIDPTSSSLSPTIQKFSHQALREPPGTAMLRATPGADPFNRTGISL